MRMLRVRRGRSGASYPAIVDSLDIRDVYDLQTSGNTGYRSTPLKIPGVDSLGALSSVATWDATNFRMRLNGAYTGTRRVFSGWDFKSVAAYIEITTPGWTISDCLCGPSKVAGGVLNADNYPIKTSDIAASHTGGDANSNVIIEYNTITGYDEGTDDYYNSAAIGSTADVTGVKVRYNRILKSGSDGINPRGDDWLVEYNHGTIGGFRALAHYDFLQILQGNRLIVRRNFIDMTPSVSPADVSSGRTNAVRLEAFLSGKTVNDAVVERNYIIGSDVVDSNGQKQGNIFHVTGTGGGGAGTVDGNQINYNAVQLATGVNLIHPGSDGVSGTGNRQISDNSVLSDFSL